MRIEELMTGLPATCRPDETLSQAAQKMEGANCGFLPVMGGSGSQRLVGLITDGDIRMAAQLRGRSLEELRVRDAMAREVRVCGPRDSLFEAEAIMQEAGIRCLPVVDESGRLLGVLSLAEVAREAEREREEASFRIIAAQLGLVVSTIREPYWARKPTRLPCPAHSAQASRDEPAAAS